MAVMIDWVTARVPCTMPAPINGGCVVAVKPSGEVEWATDRRLQVEGSHSSTMAVRGTGSLLELSGSPAKFLQGHNLFGSGDVVGGVCRVMERLTSVLELVPSEHDRELWRSGGFDLTRVDVTRMYDLGSRERVRAALDALRVVARVSHQRTDSYGSGTVYLGQRSRRLSLKLYDKLAELLTRGHGLPDTMAPVWHQKLTEWASGKLRAELTLRGKELAERRLRLGAAWSPTVAESLLNERLDAVQLNDTVRLADDELRGLPGRLVAVYEAWRAGRDVRALYSRPTFYRYRRELLEHGIDIARVRPRVVQADTEYVGGEPLRGLLSGPGCDSPEWAKGTELLAG